MVMFAVFQRVRVSDESMLSIEGIERAVIAVGRIAMMICRHNEKSLEVMTSLSTSAKTQNTGNMM